MTDLSGKRALVTGGGGGLGADMARGLAAAGAEVWIAGRRLEALEQVAATHPGLHPVTADVTDEASVAAMFEAAGRCDIVVANAGASESAPFGKTSLDAWNRMIAVNLTGAFLTLRDGARQLADAKWGRLIAVASTAGLKGYGYVSAYAAAKHGTVGMVKSAALELARSGVTVNALCPGFLETEMTDASVANIVAKTGMTSEAARASLEKMSPQRRLIRPQEVTAAALWLCGPGSEGITGQAISVSGGEV
ncbi:SDR family NAD(P)-dependent oxidoreductase [Pseudooceanicola sp. LIPI14-2-Ac024]|uniref:SDR family NAD(P)-dependent oxidoreductase n=1 Tax=Pseudooceanicola sp. LIPI14-2-Ac024 TaxID=3344875 RepID=UPI0035CF9EFB